MIPLPTFRVQEPKNIRQGKFEIQIFDGGHLQPWSVISFRIYDVESEDPMILFGAAGAQDGGDIHMESNGNIYLPDEDKTNALCDVIKRLHAEIRSML